MTFLLPAGPLKDGPAPEAPKDAVAYVPPVAPPVDRPRATSPSATLERSRSPVQGARPTALPAWNSCTKATGYACVCDVHVGGRRCSCICVSLYRGVCLILAKPNPI